MVLDKILNSMEDSLSVLSVELIPVSTALANTEWL